MWTTCSIYKIDIVLYFQLHVNIFCVISYTTQNFTLLWDANVTIVLIVVNVLNVTARKLLGAIFDGDCRLCLYDECTFKLCLCLCLNRSFSKNDTKLSLTPLEGQKIYYTPYLVTSLHGKQQKMLSFTIGRQSQNVGGGDHK